jgi:sterol 3beta-glucosyltransferase
MKIVIMGLGTRGDVEPVLAIGEMLRDKGHDVVCGMSEQFRDLAEDTGLKFFPFAKEYLEILDSETGAGFMEQKGSFLNKASLFLKMYKQSQAIQKKLVKEQKALILQEHPDRVIHSMKCIYPVVWGMANPGKSFMVLPIPGTLHKVTTYSPLLPTKKHAKKCNKLVFSLVHNAFARQIKSYTKKYLEDFKDITVTTNAIKSFILKKETAFYTISPTLFHRPDEWPDNAKIVGYHERQRTTNWEPDESLLSFLNQYPKILFVTFGSMTNTNPVHKTRILMEILEKHHIPTIINTSSGGLVKTEDAPEHILFTQTIPYEWIFPRVYGVIHHGGSGTTHMAMKYGCANMVIPHILDQFFWRYLTAKLGVGPKGISIKKISIKNLEPLLLELWENKTFKKNAEQVSEQMQQEDFRETLIEKIEKNKMQNIIFN